MPQPILRGRFLPRQIESRLHQPAENEDCPTVLADRVATKNGKVPRRFLLEHTDAPALGRKRPPCRQSHAPRVVAWDELHNEHVPGESSQKVHYRSERQPIADDEVMQDRQTEHEVEATCSTIQE